MNNAVLIKNNLSKQKYIESVHISEYSTVDLHLGSYNIYPFLTRLVIGSTMSCNRANTQDQYLLMHMMAEWLFEAGSNREWETKNFGKDKWMAFDILRTRMRENMDLNL